jgi:iron complex transport system ATP-binding protein
VFLSGCNGSGKSTLLKLIANDIDSRKYKNYKINGKILDQKGCDILEGNREEFSKTICYIPQEDCFIGADIFEELSLSLILTGQAGTKRDIYNTCEKFRLKEILLNLDENIKDIDKVFKLNPNKLSGGQQKIVSVISNLIRCEHADLCIVDEPLNNLDIRHVRAICNLLTYINQELKKAIILVSHCRVFPNIKKEFFLENGNMVQKEVENCYACFGKPDKLGYYR